AAVDSALGRRRHTPPPAPSSAARTSGTARSTPRSPPAWRSVALPAPAPPAAAPLFQATRPAAPRSPECWPPSRSRTLPPPPHLCYDSSQPPPVGLPVVWFGNLTVPPL